MYAQVKLPVKKIQWKGFIGLLGSHSIQMYNWPRNLLLEDVFLVNYSQKDTTFWDKLWAACQGQLGLWHLPSGSDILVVDKSGHSLLMVDQGKSFSMRKLILRMRWILTTMSRIPGLPNTISPLSITMLHLCHPLSHNVKVQRRGNLMLLMRMGVSLPNAIRPPIITMLHLHPHSHKVRVRRKGNLMLLMSMGVSLPNTISPPIITMPYLHHPLSHNAKVRMLCSLKSFLLMRLVVGMGTQYQGFLWLKKAKAHI